MCSRTVLETDLGDQLRWMKSTRFLAPLGHIGTGLTYAMPFGVLGLIAAAALGHGALGVGLFAVALVNRVVPIDHGWLGNHRRSARIVLVVALSSS